MAIELGLRFRSCGREWQYLASVRPLVGSWSYWVAAGFCLQVEAKGVWAVPGTLPGGKQGSRFRCASHSFESITVPLPQPLTFDVACYGYLFWWRYRAYRNPALPGKAAATRPALQRL